MRTTTIFGVTGKSCSGKSSFCVKFTTTHGLYVSIDELCHQELEKRRVDVCELFGLPLTASRREIGEKAFTNRDKYDVLVQWTWPPVEKTVLDIIELSREDVYLDYILLPLAKTIWDKCDVKILVEAPKELRTRRALERDGLTLEQFALRDSKSIEYDKFSFDYRVFTGEA